MALIIHIKHSFSFQHSSRNSHVTADLGLKNFIRKRFVNLSKKGFIDSSSFVPERKHDAKNINFMILAYRIMKFFKPTKSNNTISFRDCANHTVLGSKKGRLC